MATGGAKCPATIQGVRNTDRTRKRNRGRDRRENLNNLGQGQEKQDVGKGGQAADQSKADEFAQLFHGFQVHLSQ